MHVCIIIKLNVILVNDSTTSISITVVVLVQCVHIMCASACMYVHVCVYVYMCVCVTDIVSRPCKENPGPMCVSPYTLYNRTSIMLFTIVLCVYVLNQCTHSHKEPKDILTHIQTYHPCLYCFTSTRYSITPTVI